MAARGRGCYGGNSDSFSGLFKSKIAFYTLQKQFKRDLSEDPYDFPHIWDIKQKATNDLTKQTQNRKVVSRGDGGWRRMKRIKGVKIMVMVVGGD